MRSPDEGEAEIRAAVALGVQASREPDAQNRERLNSAVEIVCEVPDQ